MERIKCFDIVIGSRNMMSATEVNPLHLFNIFSEFLIDDLNGTLKCIGVLLAHRVEMQSVNAFKLVWFKIVQCDPKSRMCKTWIVHIDFNFRVLRIYTNPDTQFVFEWFFTLSLN